MLTEYTFSNDISYNASNWCYDLMQLKNSPADNGQCIQTVYWRDIVNASKGTVKQTKFDKTFAINSKALVAVNLFAKLIVSFEYMTKACVYGKFQLPDSRKWIDAMCVTSGVWQGNYNFSIYILTDQNQLIVFTIEPYSNTFLNPYNITINSKHNYTKLVSCESGEVNEYGSGNQLYLWTPKKKMLQQFEIKLYSEKERKRLSIPEDCHGIAEPVPHTAVKIRPPKLNGVEFSCDGAALSLCIDVYRNSALCADARNHILFECTLEPSSLSNSSLLCGIGKPGIMKEDTDSWLNPLNSPCAPMVFRPQNYVQRDQFTSSSWNMLNAGADPRIVLLCDSENQAVRKIWQFPKTSHADDLSDLNHIYTLMQKDETAKRENKLLHLPCNRPNALYVNPCGVLTITTEDCAYILRSAVAVVDERAVESDSFTS